MSNTPTVADAVGLAARVHRDQRRRVAVNPLARRVKLGDLEDNMNVHRLTKVSSDDLERITKYHKAWRRLARLEGMLPEPDAASPTYVAQHVASCLLHRIGGT